MGTPKAGELARDALEKPETICDDGHRREIGEYLNVLVEFLHGQQTRLATDQIHVGNLTLRDRTDEPVNRGDKIAELRALGVVAEDTLLVARIRHLDVTEMRNCIVLDVLTVFVVSSS